MNSLYVPATALGGDLFPRPVRHGGWIGWCEWEWLPGSWVIRAFNPGCPNAVRFDPRDPGVAHRVADVLRAKGCEVGHLLPRALGGQQGDAETVVTCTGCERGAQTVPVAALDSGRGCGPAICVACPHCDGIGTIRRTIPAADVSALLLAASVAGVEVGGGVVQGVVGEWKEAAYPVWGRMSAELFAAGRDAVKGWVRDLITPFSECFAGVSARGTMSFANGRTNVGWCVGSETGPETGPEGCVAADAALDWLGYARLDPRAPFGVVVPTFNLRPR